MSQKESFKDNINNIITDLLNEGTYTDFMELQDNKTCHAHTIFLEQELQHRFKKLELKEFGSQLLFISPHKYKPCKTENCDGTDEEMQKKKYGVEGNLKSKGQICRAIAVYYVRIFNILAAIMVAIDPENNMCIRRMRALYKNINDDTFKVEICSAGKELYPEDVMKVEGIQELVGLYQMYNVEGMEEQNEKVRQQIEQLQKKINQYFNAKSIQSSNIGNQPTNLGNNGEENSGFQETQKKLNETLAANTQTKNPESKPNNNRASKPNTRVNQGNRGNQGNTRANPTNNRGNQGNTRANPTNNRGNQGNTRANPTQNITQTELNQSPPETMPNTTQGALPTNQVPPGALPNTTQGALPNTTQGAMSQVTQGVNIAVNSESDSESNSNPNKTMRGGKRNSRKNKRGTKRTKKQRGGGLFDNMLGFFTGPKKETDAMEPNATPAVEGTSSVIVARENLQTIQDFRKFMETKRAGFPKDMIKDGSPMKLSGKPQDLSKSKECKATGDEAVDREIKKTDKSFTDYIENYNKMNEHYKFSKDQLKEILMSLIKKSEINGKFKLKDISSAELSEIESKTRETLLNYYSICQELFIVGFNSLNDGIDNAEVEREREKKIKEVEKLEEEKKAKKERRLSVSN